MADEILIVGAGFSGAVIARQLAESGRSCLVVDSREHIAGNCHTERVHGVMVHRYGPHIFHTNRRDVWEYINNFGEFVPYIHRVKATTDDGIFSLPINLLTLNQFFGRAMNPREAVKFLDDLTNVYGRDPRTFEEQGLSSIGRRLYESFFEGYTAKQWGRSPSELPASILKRLPVRFSYDDNYFSHPFQGIPVDGYTKVVERMLTHDKIRVETGMRINRDHLVDFRHCFWTAPLDSFFDYSLGRLPYRTLRFEEEHHEGDYQGCAQMNYCSSKVPYTRVTEHKHFAPWEDHSNTVIFREYSDECGHHDEPYYPVRLASEVELLTEYVRMSKESKGVTFVGRLATYRYLDMDVTIHEALSASRDYFDAVAAGDTPLKFSANPINGS